MQEQEHKECGERKKRGECSLRFRRISQRIPGNISKNSVKYYHFKVPLNVQKDSGNQSRRFQAMLLKITGNPIKDSGECLRGFRKMFGKTSRFDSRANDKIKQMLKVQSCKSKKH